MDQKRDLIIRAIIHAEVESDVYKEESDRFGIEWTPEMKILRDMQLLSNFSLQILLIPWNWANESPEDVKFTKNIGPMFTAGKAEIAIGDNFLTIPRMRLGLVPLQPVFNNKLWAYFQQPHFTIGKNIYSQPFSSDLFFGYFILTLVFVLSVSIFLKLLGAQKDCRDCVHESLWWIMAFSVLKNYNFNAKGRTLRIIFLTGSFFFSLIFAVYSAFITSALLANTAPIKSMDDLIKAGFSFFCIPQLRQIILNPEVHKTPEGFDEMNGVDSFKKVVQGGHVHIDGIDGFNYYGQKLGWSTKEMCEKVSQLIVSEGSNSKLLSGFYIPRLSQHRNMFNRNIIQLYETGLVTRYNSIYAKTQGFKCPSYLTIGYQENLGISHVFGALSIFLASVPLGIFFLVGEKILRPYFNYRDSHD